MALGLDASAYLALNLAVRRRRGAARGRDHAALWPLGDDAMIRRGEGGRMLNVVATYAWTGMPGVAHSAMARTRALMRSVRRQFGFAREHRKAATNTHLHMKSGTS